VSGRGKAVSALFRASAIRLVAGTVCQEILLNAVGGMVSLSHGLSTASHCHGPMTRAEFFNAKLTDQPVTDALTVRLTNHLQAKPEPKGKNLAQ